MLNLSEHFRLRSINSKVYQRIIYHSSLFLNFNLAWYIVWEKNEQLSIEFLIFLQNDRCLRFNFDGKNAFFFEILLSEAALSLISLLSKYKTFAKPLLKSGRNFLAKTHIYFWNLYAKLSKLFGASFGYIGTKKSKNIFWPPKFTFLTSRNFQIFLDGVD